MSEIDQLDFLISKDIVLADNVVYIFQRRSRFAMRRTINKIVDTMICKGMSPISGDPERLVFNSVFEISGRKSCFLIDLWSSDIDKSGGDKEKSEFINTYVRHLTKSNGDKNGSVLVLPSEKYSSIDGPLWGNTIWPSWLNISSNATVVLEGIVSIESVPATVRKLMLISDLPSMSSVRNVEVLVDYLERYVHEEAPTLLEFSQRLDMAALIGVDQETRNFDARALGEDGSDWADTPSIGASLRSFLADPTSEHQRAALCSLDERLNRRSTASFDALRQLANASAAHINGQNHSSGSLVLWAWLLLSWETPLSKPAVIDAYFGGLTRYKAWCRSEQERISVDLNLDVVVNAIAACEGENASSLDRARGKLAHALVHGVATYAGRSAPDWLLKLRIAMELKA